MRKSDKYHEIDIIRQELSLTNYDIAQSAEFPKTYKESGGSLFKIIFIMSDTTNYITTLHNEHLISKNAHIYIFDINELFKKDFELFFKDKEFIVKFIEIEYINYKIMSEVINKYFNPISKSNNTYSFMFNDNIIIITIGKYRHQYYMFFADNSSCETSTLEKLIQIGKDLHLSYFIVNDNSRINAGISKCEYSMAHYYILLDGLSWYNKFNFYTFDGIEKQEEINIHNNVIRNHSLIGFLNEYIKKEAVLNTEEKTVEYTTLLTEEINAFIHKFIEEYNKTVDIPPINETTKVCDIISGINNKIYTLTCDNILLELLADLIKYSEKILYYDRTLILSL